MILYVYINRNRHGYNMNKYVLDPEPPAAVPGEVTSPTGTNTVYALLPSRTNNTYPMIYTTVVMAAIAVG